MIKAALIIIISICVCAFFAFTLRSQLAGNLEKKNINNVSRPTYDVTLHSQADNGQFLADGNGRPLYIFDQEFDGVSHCLGDCLKNWRPFFADQPKIYGAIDKSDFDQIVRADGMRQTTWKNWPLYYFSEDKSQGDFLGDGFEKAWYLAKPDYDIFIGDNGQQRFLIGKDGMALYDLSSCDAACQEDWQAFDMEHLYSLPTGLSRNVLGEFQLYYFKADPSRGVYLGLDEDAGATLVNPEVVQ